VKGVYYMIDNEHPPELFVSAGELVTTFYGTLDQLPDAEIDLDTEKFWEEHPEAWDAARLDAKDPGYVMTQFMAWLKDLMSRHTVSLVAYPSGFDFTFLYWYMQTFCGESPLMHSCIDIRSFVMGMTGRPFRRTGKKYWPKRWSSGMTHNHNALSDATEQGLSFIKILRQSRGMMRLTPDQ
jgi:hypothetical protein